ncbi:MAG: deaminase, partial [Verrucomicrobiota bacterium]
MALPYKVATLLYGFNRAGDILLLERAQEPNQGLWSPFGGKLHQADGESPHACAIREAREEAGLELTPADLHLVGVVSESGYEGRAHWLMFLFEILTPLEHVPPPDREGRFAFIPRNDLASLPVPATDREQIWPLFWRHRGGFFAAHCTCHADGASSWELLESRPAVDADDVASPEGDASPGNEDGADGAETFIDRSSDDFFMGEALRQAVRAQADDEVPIGCVVTRAGRVIARASNQVELLKDATAHAEMLAISQAQQVVGDWRLGECTLYVTKEPCPMCAGAIVLSRLRRVIFGCPDPK